ncbi:MAG: response regulator [Alphaproteobacteria bacterium]|nr:response regulator [Alphaproteobacteria bacterium]
MLCSLKTHRPDKLLQKRLLQLAYSLIALAAAIILFMVYPEYYLYLILSMLILCIFCLALTIKTLRAGEEAISYGGFANEIIKNEFKARRIDNAAGEPVIQNDVARELLKNEPILEYLEKQLSENRLNKAAFYRLQTACRDLAAEKVTLALNLHHDRDRIFADEEWFEITVRPIFLKKTDIFEGPFSIKAIKKDTYLYWNFQDITAAKNMEHVFQEERKNLHDFLDDLPVGLYTCTRDFQIEYANHAFARIVGVAREDLIGTDFRKYLGENVETPQNTTWSGRLFFVSTAHETIECFVAQESFRGNREYKIRGVAVAGIPSDRDVKKELSASLDKISWLFNYAPVGIVFINRDGQITDCNAKVRSFLGAAKENILLKSIFDYVKTEDTAELKKQFAAIYASADASASLDVHVSLGREERIIQLYISPMRRFYSFDISEIDGLVLYMIDATKQKTLEMQFAQAQKMQAMGQLAGGVAHDFNNLLTAMIGFCDLLLQRHGVGDPSFTDLIQIKQNANRAAGLVRQLLAFSRKQPLKPKLIDVTENFVELSHMLKRILGEQIMLEFYHGSDLGYIRVDPVQFSQVIINLAVNAKDAMNGSGTLSISTRTETLSEPYRFGADVIKPGEFVVIDVRDTGCGIPIENLTRIFEPFFSTKQNVVGSGTGLGLAMVYGIVRQTEGFIKVESIVGKGTTFSIHLPRFDAAVDDEEEKRGNEQDTVKAKDGSPVLTVQEKITSPVAVSQKLIFGLNVSAIDRSVRENPDAASTRILFVEDEDSVRAFGVRALKKKGFDVVACNSAENALEQLEHDKNFGLLITDMVMPGINGAELAARVREQIPAVKIILASGYSEEIARRELAGSQDFDFLAKPFSLGDLTKKVFDVLSRN